MANKTKSKSLLGKMWRIKWWLLSIITVLFLLFSLFFPLNNYYVELPGGAFDTKEVLTVDKKADDSKGSYNFVAVAQTKATLALMLYAQLNDFAKLQTAEEATGNYSDEDFMRINQFYMETSQNQAIYQGLTQAGKEASLEYMGVYVLQVADDSSFKGVLNIADTVTAVNGKTFDNSTDLIKYVQGLKLGSNLKVKSAADSGADIFFVPNNPVTKEMKKADPDAKTNYQEAKEAAKKLGTKMKIVPVKTAQEAIDYLKKTK